MLALSLQATITEGDTPATMNTSLVLVSDVDFFLKLNHTRLLSSRLNWRPSFREELGVGRLTFLN